MMNSCDRFIDRDKIEVLVTSEFRFGGWADNADQPLLCERTRERLRADYFFFVRSAEHLGEADGLAVPVADRDGGQRPATIAPASMSLVAPPPPPSWAPSPIFAWFATRPAPPIMTPSLDLDAA